MRVVLVEFKTLSASSKDMSRAVLITNKPCVCVCVCVSSLHLMCFFICGLYYKTQHFTICCFLIQSMFGKLDAKEARLFRDLLVDCWMIACR